MSLAYGRFELTLDYNLYFCVGYIDYGYGLVYGRLRLTLGQAFPLSYCDIWIMVYIPMLGLVIYLIEFSLWTIWIDIGASSTMFHEAIAIST